MSVTVTLPCVTCGTSIPPTATSGRAHGLKRALIAPFAHYMRLWDYASASRVDRFIANSRNVRTRIWKTYRRESEVIYPPVDVETFRHERAEDYFLAVSELVPYKRIDLSW